MSNLDAESKELSRPSAEQDTSKIDRMGTEPLLGLLIKFSLPSIAGLLVTSLYGLVDGIFIGLGVGDAGIAATAAAMPFFAINMALNTLIGNGGNIVASIRLGEGRHAEAEKSLGNAVMMLFIVSIVFLVVFLPFLDPILWASGATPESIGLARPYVTILVVGFFASCLSAGIGNYVRTAGSPNIAMALMISGGVINIFLDWLMVLELGWGMEGAAIATVISSGLAAVGTMYFFGRKKAALRFRFKYLRLEKRMVIDILKLGLAGFFMNMLMVITTVIINQIFIHYGDQEAITGTGALAGQAASGRVQQIFFQIIVGITMAAQPILGYNYGANKLVRVKKAYWTASHLGFVGLLIATLIAELIPEMVLSLFGLSPIVMDFAVYIMRVVMVLLPLAAYGIMASTYFMATEQPGKANILVLLRQIVLLVPIVFLTPIVLPAMFGISPVHSIIWAFPIVDIISTIISMLFVFHDLKKLNAKIARGESADSPQVLAAAAAAEAAEVVEIVEAAAVSETAESAAAIAESVSAE